MQAFGFVSDTLHIFVCFECPNVPRRMCCMYVALCRGGMLMDVLAFLSGCVWWGHANTFNIIIEKLIS